MATGINANSDVSLVLCRLLDSLGLDEDTRQRRMNIQKMNQLLLSWWKESISGNNPVLFSGSAYEATTIAGLSSDVDVMFIQHDIRVIDNIQQWTPDTSILTYMMDNTGCYPAFVKLYIMSCDYPGPLYSDSVGGIPPGHVVDDEGKILLCNDFISKLIQRHNPNVAEIHGPALSHYIAGIDCDYVPTLLCKSFPQEAEEWKRRQTHITRARIGGAIVDQATCCYIVGVGNKGSPTENIEWRLSFSHIENQLIHAWNNVQYKCYVMMKFIHKDLIKPNIPDCILCSYHYKTTLMWMVEEYPVEFFTELNFGNCVLAVLNNLAICVTRKSLPHYFVQGCDLFHNKLEEKSSKQTTAVNKSIISTWPYCLYNIERRELGEALRMSLLHVSLDTMCEVILQTRRVNLLQFDYFCEANLLHFNYDYVKRNVLSKKHIEIFKLLLNLVQCSKHTALYYTAEHKQFVTFVVKDILCSVGLQLIRHSDTMTNKAALYHKRVGLGCIQKFINDCSFDTELQVAEYFTGVGNYQHALLLLDKIESRMRDYTVYNCRHTSCNRSVSTSHTTAVFDNKPSMKEYCKYYHAVPVTYTQDILPRVPRSLVYEMFRTTTVSPPVSPAALYPDDYDWYNHAVIHCPVYLYYLRFLCFHALGRYTHRQVALDNMTWASKQLETSSGTHIETNHNIIGHCYRILGQQHKAYREYKKSLLKQKYHNAAIWHLALIMRRKVRSDPRES